MRQESPGSSQQVPQAVRNTELIERLAREAWGVEEHFFGTPQLARFAALVAEQCARKVELSASAEQAASAIRAAFPMPKD